MLSENNEFVALLKKMNDDSHKILLPPFSSSFFMGIFQNSLVNQTCSTSTSKIIQKK